MPLTYCPPVYNHPIESIKDVVYFALEVMICNGRRFAKYKAGKRVLFATKVFSYIMHDPILKKLYLDVANQKGVPDDVAIERGALIVRSAMVHIIKKVGGPVADALRLSLIRDLTPDDYEFFCRLVVSCVEETEKYEEAGIIEGVAHG